MPSAESFKIHKGLKATYERIRDKGIETDVLNAKLIIFSDQHRGERDKADDFEKCEKAYHAALGYYLESGYTLILLGDIEELWECSPTPVLKAYKKTLALEAEFIKAGRYFRIRGNHDDYWRDASDAEKKSLMPPGAGGPLAISEGLRLVHNTDNARYVFYLVHGHQGTVWSDEWGTVSRWIVRNGWRNIQRLTGFASTTSAKSTQLRDEHSRAMYEWVSSENSENAQEKVILIAGHTHKPVFCAGVGLAGLEAHLKNLRDSLVSVSEDKKEAHLEQIAGTRARIEFQKVFPQIDKPCYFNTGCCSYEDGDITGIEIAGGKIALVRWPDDCGKPIKKQLAEADIKADVFAEI